MGPDAAATTQPSALERYPLSQGVNPWLVTVSVMPPKHMKAPPRAY
jgi:hypothetical protein